MDSSIVSVSLFCYFVVISLDSSGSSRQGSFKASAKETAKKVFPGLQKNIYARTCRKSAARKRKDEVISGSSVPKDLINIDVSGSKYVIELTVLNRYEGVCADFFLKSLC